MVQTVDAFISRKKRTTVSYRLEYTHILGEIPRYTIPTMHRCAFTVPTAELGDSIYLAARAFYPMLLVRLPTFCSRPNLFAWERAYTFHENRQWELGDRQTSKNGKNRRQNGEMRSDAVASRSLVWNYFDPGVWRFLLSGGSLGYQAEQEEKFTGNFTPVQLPERKRGGLILKSPARAPSGAVHRHFRQSWTSLAVHRALRFLRPSPSSILLRPLAPLSFHFLLFFWNKPRSLLLEEEIKE